MKRILALCCAALLALTGCTGAVASVRPDPTPNPSAAVMDAGADRAAAAFGAELLRQVRREGEDTLVSPLSALLALSMTAGGAAGDTRTAMLEALGGAQLDALNANCASLLADYAALGGSTELNIANSLWVDDTLEPLEQFLASCGDFYGAAARRLDLQAPATVDAVNAWVEEHTGGKIPNMLDKISPETVLLLANALYLNTTWRNEFDPRDNWTAQFRPDGGAAVEVEYLNNGIRQERYIRSGREEGVLLPYDDGRLAFLAVRPLEGDLTQYLKGWDGQTLPGLIAAAEDTRLLLHLPKFEAEWGGDLSGALRAMGMELAFDPGRADFSGLAADAPERQIYIGAVAHKTLIDVNEKGTEAAAATVVAMKGGSAAPAQDYEELILDTPFVYGIVDLERGVPLFLGTFETGETGG